MCPPRIRGGVVTPLAPNLRSFVIVVASGALSPSTESMAFGGGRRYQGEA
jgi:hypothetical protein